jgi:hypothetical protein
MQKTATSNLFLTASSSLKWWYVLPTVNKQDEFYQQLTRMLIKGIRSRQSLVELGNWLIAIAHKAYSARQMDVVDQASQALMNLPLGNEFRNIAYYYQAYCIKRKGQFDEARTLFEQVADEGSSRYRAKAIAALGSIALDSGDISSAMSLNIEATKTACHRQYFDPLAALYGQHTVAVLKGLNEDHRGAIADLETALPLARVVGTAFPAIYCNYLNSLAVEMTATGRLEEAQSLSRIVLATPYAGAYPEWRETWDEIQLKAYRARRSVVSFYQKSVSLYQETQSDNVLQLPERSPEAARPEPARRQKAAKVISLQQWKEKMAKEDILQNIYELSDKDLFLEILELSSQDSITTAELQNILVAVIKITSKQDNPA